MSKRDDIYKILKGSSTTKKNRVDDLISNGYLVEERRGLHNIKLITITSEGERVCRLLKEIETGSKEPDNNFSPLAESGAPSKKEA